MIEGLSTEITHRKLNHMQKILLSAISLIILGSILVGNFLLIAGCSSKQTSTIEVLEEYAAESLGEDDQLVVLGGGYNRKCFAGQSDYIDFRGSRSEKRYRARLYRDSFLSDWKMEIVKLRSKVIWIVDANQTTDPAKIKVDEKVSVPQKKSMTK